MLSQFTVKPNFSPNQVAVYFEKNEFLYHEDSQDTGVWNHCVVCL